MNSIVCPVSVEKIDSNVSRLTVFFNVVLMALFVATQNPIFIAFVAIDYMLRVGMDTSYSPLRFLSSRIIGLIGLKKKPIGLAQKVFASRLGVICAVAGVILFLAGMTVASIVVVSVLMVLAFLDSVLDLCMGCLIYNYVVLPWSQKR